MGIMSDDPEHAAAPAPEVLIGIERASYRRAQPIARDASGKYLKGQTGNRTGRPRTGTALTEIIREVMGEEGLFELARLAKDIATGRPVNIDTEWIKEAEKARAAGLPEPPRRGQSIQPTIAEMQRAWEWLATWGYQKPVQVVELTTASKSAIDPNLLSQEDLDALEAIQRKALAAPE